MDLLSSLLFATSTGLIISIALIIKYRNQNKKCASRIRQLLRAKTEQETAFSLMRERFEKEKELFSKTLHDEVGNSLASMRLMVDALGRTRYEGDFDMLLYMQKELERSMGIVRNISKDAYPPSLKTYGLGIAIEELCDRLSNPKLTKISFEEKGHSIRLNTDVELVLYRATQELIGNAIKHSLAWFVTVSMEWNEDELLIIVEDNGVGYGPWKKDKGGMGFKTIDSSLKSIKGKIFLDRNRTGFMAEIALPIYNESHQIVHSG